mgnify:CR=1
MTQQIVCFFLLKSGISDISNGEKQSSSCCVHYHDGRAISKKRGMRSHAQWDHNFFLWRFHDGIHFAVVPMIKSGSEA